MKTQRVAIALTAINLVLLGFTMLRSFETARAAGEPPADGELPTLRARGLEIVDDQGRTRALLAVMPPATVDGKDYPETVLLRLIDPTSGPVVKLTAARDGSALMLSDDADGGVMVRARDTGNSVTVTSRDGENSRLAP